MRHFHETLGRLVHAVPQLIVLTTAIVELAGVLLAGCVVTLDGELELDKEGKRYERTLLKLLRRAQVVLHLDMKTLTRPHLHVQLSALLVVLNRVLQILSDVEGLR